MAPRVSVVIPAYNAAPFLRETLDSVMSQTCRDFEVVVVDDGSIDDTAGIAESYGARVRVIRTPNRGVARARNTGIEEAKGEFVAFLDSDDLWRPDKLARQLAVVGAESRFVYSDTVSFGIEAMADLRMSDGKKIPSGDILGALVEDNFIATSTVLLDRRIALQAGGFNADLAVGEDWYLWLQVARLTRGTFVPEPLVQYRVRRGSLGSNVELRMRCCQQVIESGLSLLSIPMAEAAALRRRALAACYAYGAMLANADGRHGLALRLKFAAFAHDPSGTRFKAIIKGFIGRA
jgi:glycosyltransferase involved in cell wall biosynthesis